MRPSKKQERHEAITAAAYELLAKSGYNSTSMLNIAKAAKASNETLYRWYGDKKGLFGAMVKDNAAHVKTMLEHAIDSEAGAQVTLQTIAPVLLEMLMNDRAVLLNRAAAADHSGELGTVVSEEGRNTIAPLIGNLMQELTPQNTPTPAQLSEWYLSLLIGDWQTRRIIGSLPMPTPAAINARSETAHAAFLTLLTA